MESARERYGGAKVTRSRSRCVKSKSNTKSVSDAARRASAVVFEDEDSVFEKKTRDVSSIGWKMIRAANEPDLTVSKVRVVVEMNSHRSSMPPHSHLGRPRD